MFVVLKEDKRCKEYYGIVRRDDQALAFYESPRLAMDDFNTPKAKTVTILIEEIIDPSEYVVPTLMPLLFTFLLIFMVFGIFSAFQNLK